MYEFDKLIRNMPISIAELIRRSGVNERTLTRMRRGEKVQRHTANRVLAALSDVYHETYNLDNVTGINYQD